MAVDRQEIHRSLDREALADWVEEVKTELEISSHEAAELVKAECVREGLVLDLFDVYGKEWMHGLWSQYQGKDRPAALPKSQKGIDELMTRASRVPPYAGLSVIQATLDPPQAWTPTPNLPAVPTDRLIGLTAVAERTPSRKPPDSKSLLKGRYMLDKQDFVLEDMNKALVKRLAKRTLVLSRTNEVTGKFLNYVADGLPEHLTVGQYYSEAKLLEIWKLCR